MKKILKDTYKGLDEKNEKQSENEKQLAVRVNENKFQIKKNDDYENLNLKAVNVNLDEPEVLMQQEITDITKNC